MTEPWVPIEAVVAHLKVTKDSVYRWIESKGLPAQKVGRHWRFKLTEIDAWVRGGTVGEAIQIDHENKTDGRSDK